MEYSLSYSSIYDTKGVQIEAPKYAFRRRSKRNDLMTFQNSDNDVPVKAGVQLTVIREGVFLDFKIASL